MSRGVGLEENQEYEYKKKSEVRYTQLLIISGSLSENLVDMQEKFTNVSYSQIIYVVVLVLLIVYTYPNTSVKVLRKTFRFISYSFNIMQNTN